MVAYTVRDPAESKGSEDMVQRGGLFDDERCLGCYVQCGEDGEDHLRSPGIR